MKYKLMGYIGLVCLLSSMLIVPGNARAEGGLVPTKNMLLDDNNMNSRAVSGNYGMEVYINGENLTLKPIITIEKDDASLITFSHMFQPSSKENVDFSMSKTYGKSVTLKSLPKVTAPETTSYTMEYSVDGVSFNEEVPSSISDIKGLRVKFDKLGVNEKVFVESTVEANWDQAHSGTNLIAELFLDGKHYKNVEFDSYRLVTVRYVDEDGNDIHPAKELTGENGEEYNSQAEIINGWTLKAKPTNATGKFADEDQEVIYVYERSEAAPVIIRYQDEQGNALSEEVILNGKFGLPYESKVVSIDGWTLKEKPANATGTFSLDKQIVTYVYVKNEVAVPPTDPTDPTDPTNPTNPIDSNGTENSNPTQNTNDKGKEKPNEILPQTGEESILWLSGLGAILLSILGYTFYKRRH
ncbi:LPXTG cell wall anchor domain-containing protein [Vagococcus coleopterorum]|uniref:LPXTG cell wall anchor domain-containing protein n=1 Tax=Vagococcus coleopterorum TaxID=2714946 RepID=A0A6G8AML2_9ENTE|nr:MucBP domain-containing protein [Vagococcus coleopterorum]QIL46210.1 LPXTG cell wall anchor domain-containing protein [Vagococcus coleopterorum]